MLVATTQEYRSLRLFAGVGLFIMALSLRPGIVSMGPLVHAIQSEFGMKHAEAALLTAILDLCMGICAIFVPAIGRRFGGDRVVLFSLALLGVALAMRAFAGSPGSLLFATLLVGIGVAISGPPSSVAGSRAISRARQRSSWAFTPPGSVSGRRWLRWAARPSPMRVAGGGWAPASGPWSAFWPLRAGAA